VKKAPITAFVFLIPAMVLILVIDVVPGFIALILSFFKIRFFGAGEFVGYLNYVNAFGDPEFLSSFKNTLVFSISSVILTILLAFPLALLLERLGKYGVFLLSVILVPWIISRVAAALLWKWILDSSQAGLANHLFSFVGLGPFPFLSHPFWAMASLVFVSLWRTLGYALILLFSGLRNIPTHIINAAKVDGASAWYRFGSIILPLMKHPLLVVLSVLTLSYFNEIQLIIGLTNGGPIDATTTLSFLVFKQANINFNTGYANTLSVILFVCSMVLVALYYRLLAPRDKP
jgi:multiple sugar transport system permease protein